MFFSVLNYNISFPAGEPNGITNVDYTAYQGMPGITTGILRADATDAAGNEDKSWQLPFETLIADNGADINLIFVFDLEAPNSEGRRLGVASEIRGKFAVIAGQHEGRAIALPDQFSTILHEVGHMLGLYHPFDLDSANPASLIAVPDFNTDRLMDYHKGYRLIRREWEVINPQDVP